MRNVVNLFSYKCSKLLGLSGGVFGNNQVHATPLHLPNLIGEKKPLGDPSTTCVKGSQMNVFVCQNRIGAQGTQLHVLKRGEIKCLNVRQRVSTKFRPKGPHHG